MTINHKDMNCRSCINYNECRSIESKHKDELEELQGNWRAVFDNGKRVGTPIRRCALAIVETHLNKFRDRAMLEVGCGPLSEIDYTFCKQHRIQYTGIDPERLPLYHIPHTKGKELQNKLVTTFLKTFNIKELQKRNLRQRYIKDSFPCTQLNPDSFDLIYGNSSMEHWHETVDDMQLSLDLYKKDINNCYDLLKPGGILLMNFPMYVHGNKIFLFAKVDLIETFFGNKWKSIEFEHWRESHDDLMPYCPLLTRKIPFKEKYGIDLDNIWLLNIVATK